MNPYTVGFLTATLTILGIFFLCNAVWRMGWKDSLTEVADMVIQKYLSVYPQGSHEREVIEPILASILSKRDELT